MLDKEQRRKLAVVRNDIAHTSDPKNEEKTPVHRLAKELNRSVRWVTLNVGSDVEDVDASYCLTSRQESRVRAAHRIEETPRPTKPEPVTLTVKRLASELRVPVNDVLDELVRRGITRKRAKSSLLLSPDDVAILRGYFAERTRARHRKPVLYRPSPDGKISFETYERIPALQLEELIASGFLPALKDLLRQPDVEWQQVINHFRHERDMQLVVRVRRNARRVRSAAPPIPAHRSDVRETMRPVMTPTSSLRSSTSEGNTPSAEKILAADKADKRANLRPSPAANTAPSLDRTRPASVKNTALIPPKPASVAQRQSRSVAGLVKKEAEGGQHTGVPPVPVFRTYPTTVSAGSTAVSDLQETLREFHPRMYATFFDQFRDVLEVDRLVARTMRPGTGFTATDPEHVRIINEVCEYSYGIFAYWEMGSKIGRQARSHPLPNAKRLKTALMNLRPMYKGVLTDLCHGRFVFWRVGEIWDLVEVRFDDAHDWLDGLADGEYVPLTTHHIPLGDNKSLVTPRDLSNRNQDIVKFMSEAAQNLRQGVRGVRGRKATNGGAALESRTSGASASSGPRTLGYRPENTWLVPITITDGHVDTTLDEDFFTSPDDQKPHQVRSFYRRPKGSSPNAPRTEYVSGHVRGGRGAFADMKLLPTVTIRRR